MAFLKNSVVAGDLRVTGTIFGAGNLSSINANNTGLGTSGQVLQSTGTGIQWATMATSNHNHDSTYLKLSGGTLTGALTLNANPTANMHAATKQYVDNAFAANDAMIFKGTLGTGGTITSLPATHNAGWTYRVITASTYAGKVCEVGDLMICVTDSTSANDAHWVVAQTNIDGAVTGPASSVNNRIAIFDGTTGKIIKDSGYTTGSFASSSHTHSHIVTEGDNRNVATTPNDYNNKIAFRGLKSTGTVNNPSNDSYSYLIGLRGWSDSSGGDSHELAFNNTGIYVRHGATTTWGSWSKLVTTADTATSVTAVSTTSAVGTSLLYARQDHTHAISLATGDSNGQVKIAGSNVSVKGLGTAAYTASTAYSASTHTHAVSIAADSGTNALTLAHGTKYKLTAGGSTFIFTTPSDNNTDVNVRQQLYTQNYNLPLLMAYQTNTNTTTNVDNIAFRNNSIYANPSTGMVAATTYKVNEAVTLQYNSTTKSLDFIFA